MSKYFKGDHVIWIVILILSIYSLMAVYSSTESLAYKYQSGNTLFYLIKHLGLLIAGIAITFVFHYIDYNVYRRLSQFLYFISIPLLVLTMIMGTNLNSASRWLMLPGGISFQTSDLAKIALIMYLARLLAYKKDEIKDFKKAFQPILLSVIIICVLILPSNFSTALMLFAISIVMLFIGRVNTKHLLSLMGVLIITGSLFVTLALTHHLPSFWRFPTWEKRIVTFVEGGNSDDSYQSTQSKVAIYSGGLIGKGPGHSTQRNFLPHPYSDFIFSIIVEEWGLIFGAIPLILLYLFLLYRAGVIIRQTNDLFAALLAIGLTFSIVFQAFINMAVATGIFPVTGQTLPLVSMGGTSIFFTSSALGIILNISKTLTVEKE